MKKRDKLKRFVTKTLFGEKLEQALEPKLEIRKPAAAPPKIETAPLAPRSSETSHRETESIKAAIIPPIKPATEAESIENKSNLPNVPQTEKAKEFQQIMERRFAESLQAVSPRINIGVDLGTSFSKVVWRLGDNAFPICFGENSQSLFDYLVPTTVAFGEQNLACGVDLANDSPSLFSLANFKMCLACENEKNGNCHIGKCSLTEWHPEFFQPQLDGEEAAFVNAFFLAKLLARTKEIILGELAAKGFRQSVAVKWTANFSVPEKFIEQSPVSNAFAEVFKTAWLMAEVFGEQTELKERQTVFECYLAARDLTRRLQAQGKDFDCFAYPEIGAEVASIVRSRFSDEGLYAFVDIGAGTVDATVFRYCIVGGEAQRIPYAADIFKSGAANIEAGANKKFAGDSVSWLKRVKEEYGGLTENERGKLLKPIIAYLAAAAKNINDETYVNLIEVFREAFKKELGKDREDWRNLKLVLGGGGAKLEAYQDAATRAFTFKDSKKPQPPQVIILPKPNDFQMSGLPESDFHRFAVAYGLSHEIVNLPETIFAKDVQPIRQHSESKRKHDRDDDR